MYRRCYEFYKWENALLSSEGWAKMKGHKARVFRNEHDMWVLDVTGPGWVPGWEPVNG